MNNARTTYRITRATPDHLDLVAPLFDAYRQFYGKEPNHEGVRSFIGERLTQGDSVIYICETNDPATAAGFVQLYPLFTSVGMKKLWLLNDLFVDPAHRRKGIAELLIAESAQLARNTHAKGLLLQTGKDNTTAQRVYERLGFSKDEDSWYYELGV